MNLYLVKIRKKDLTLYNEYIGFSNTRKQQKLLENLKR